MRLTNKYNYPQCVVAMAQASLSKPVESIIRVTSLIAPPAIRYYQLHNWDDLIVDVDEFIQPGFGTAWHQYLAKYTNSDSGVYSEQNLTIDCSGIILSGTPDLRSTPGDIDDHKVTSAWSFVFGKPEWEQQLNMYALLTEANKFPIKALHINAYLKDWSVYDASRYKPDYPDRPFYHVTLPLWSIEERKHFLEEKLKDHQDGLRPCTEYERWQKPSKWAVKKNGAPKACIGGVKDREEDAKVFLSKQKNPSAYHIEYRPGGCRRCEDYCPVRSVCEFRGTNVQEV